MLTEQGRANVFRVIGRDDAQGIVAGNYLADHWADKKIAILHDGTTYGKGLADETRKQLNKRGVTEAIYQAYVPGKNDYSAEIAALQAAISPCCMSAATTPRSRSWPARHATAAIASIRLRRHPGDRGIRPHRRSRGRGHSLHLLRGPAPKRRSGAGRRAVPCRRFRTEGYTLLTYAAVQVWAQAVEKAGSLELDGDDRVTARDTSSTPCLGRSTSTKRATSRPKAGYGMSGGAANTCRWRNRSRSRRRLSRKIRAESAGGIGRVYAVQRCLNASAYAAACCSLSLGSAPLRCWRPPPPSMPSSRSARSSSASRRTGCRRRSHPCSCPARPSGSPPPRRRCWRRPARPSTARSRLPSPSRWRASRSCAPR